jgi:hypothetical protein
MDEQDLKIILKVFDRMAKLGAEIREKENARLSGNSTGRDVETKYHDQVYMPLLINSTSFDLFLQGHLDGLAI